MRSSAHSRRTPCPAPNRPVNSPTAQEGFTLMIARFALAALLLACVLAGSGIAAPRDASANHPVFVEGNCDTPMPGVTEVSPGTCGDWDGDGRIGTAEDTDEAD